MQIQRVPISWYEDYTLGVRPVWALVDGPLAIRPLFPEEDAPGWVVFHVPTGLAFDPVPTKDEARSLLAALAGHVPVAGEFGVAPSLAERERVGAAYQTWQMAQVW